MSAQAADFFADEVLLQRLGAAFVEYLMQSSEEETEDRALESADSEWLQVCLTFCVIVLTKTECSTPSSHTWFILNYFMS
jgi:hypothetical protein